MLAFLRGAQHAAMKLNVRSALNPFLWLCGTMGPLLFFFAWLFAQSEPLRPFCPYLVILGMTLIAVTLMVAVGFARYSPARLQSENYQLRDKALVML